MANRAGRSLRVAAEHDPALAVDMAKAVWSGVLKTAAVATMPLNMNCLPSGYSGIAKDKAQCYAH